MDVKHTPTPFTLRFLGLHSDTREIFSTYETKDHGWKSVKDFMSSRGFSAKNKTVFKNGFEELTAEYGFIRRVEAIEDGAV